VEARQSKAVELRCTFLTAEVFYRTIYWSFHSILPY